MIATIAALAIAATFATEVSVRTGSEYVLGKQCDPEAVLLTEPAQIGVIEAACATVKHTAQPGPEPNTAGDYVTVSLAGVLYERCRLVTMQRNHYADRKDEFVAWGFACATPSPRKRAR